MTDTWQFVFRRILSKPIYFKADGSLTSAVFKSSCGVSVDKDDGRPLDVVLLHEEQLYKQQRKSFSEQELKSGEKELRAICRVSKSVCVEYDIFVKDNPVCDNRFHALLFGNTDERDLTNGQSKALARSAEVVKRFE